MRVELNRTFFAVLFLGLLFAPAFAVDEKQPPESAVQFLSNVRDRTDIRAAGCVPFRLRASCEAAPIVRGESKIAGTYVLTWLSPFQWREEITFPGYSEVRIASQGKLWTARNAPAEAVRVFQLRELMNLRSKWTLRPDETVRDMGEKKRKGIVIRCIEVNGKKRASRRLCADTGSLVPIRSGDADSVEYSDYAPWGGKQFPRVMLAYEGTHRVLEVRVEELSENPQVDKSLFEPPLIAAVWDWCDNEEPATLLDQPPPHYPVAARRAGQQGTVSVYGIVGVDGRLSHLAVVRSASPDFDAATLAAVSGWRYQPSTCRGIRVPRETMIDVNYKLSC